MKQIMVIFTLISFVIYIGGCTKSVKITVDELKDLDKYQRAKYVESKVPKMKFESVTMSNDKKIQFIEKSGRIDLDQNIIKGMLSSGDKSIIGLDSVLYLNHKKTDLLKTYFFIILPLGVIVFGITKPDLSS